MSNHKEESSNNEWYFFIDHKQNISNKRKPQSNLYKSRHQVISGWIFRMYVIDHEDDGKRFDDLQIVDFESLPDSLEKDSY